MKGQKIGMAGNFMKGHCALYWLLAHIHTHAYTSNIKVQQMGSKAKEKKAISNSYGVRAH